MSNVRFIGCLHFGHKWMAKYRGFQDEYYHDEHLIEEWNKVVHKKDLTYILGDITMETPDYYYQLDRLKGRKIVVLGNHDRQQDVKELLKYVDSVAGMIDYKGFSLTHAPIHPNEISFCRGNIHAHIHHTNVLEEVEVMDRYGDNEGKKILTQSKYFNVDAHLMNYKPKTIDELLNQTKMSKLEIKKCALEIIDSLCDRNGFDDWWYNLDDDIEKEITSELESIIERGLYKDEKEKNNQD